MAQPVFAYLIRMFPQTSETFIAGEIMRVERLGLPLRIYSCRRPVEQVTHESVRSIQSPITYLPDPRWKQIPHILGAMRTFRQRGLAVPGDVSVVGFDGIALGDFVTPSLTTVVQPRYEAGRTAFRLLLERIEEEYAGPPRAINLETELIVRESSAPPRHDATPPERHRR